MSKDTVTLGISSGVPLPSGAEEAFGNLRTHLILGMEHGQNSILITSPAPGEGKSLVAANIAVRMAGHKCARVLLVDGNLKAPSLHHIFGRPAAQGFAEVLEGRVSLEEAVQCVGGTVSLLGSGSKQSHSEELLSGPELSTMLAKARSTFDFVVIDSPAVLTCSDTLLLARHADCTLLVLAAGRVSISEAQAAQHRLKTANARLIGSILNGVTGRDRQMYRGIQSVIEGSPQKTIPPGQELLTGSAIRSAP